MSRQETRRKTLHFPDALSSAALWMLPAVNAGGWAVWGTQLKRRKMESCPVTWKYHLGTFGPFCLFEHSAFLTCFVNILGLFLGNTWQEVLPKEMGSSSLACPNHSASLEMWLLSTRHFLTLKSWTPCHFFFWSFLIPVCKPSASSGFLPIPHPQRARSMNNTDVAGTAALTLQGNHFPVLFFFLFTPATGKRGSCDRPLPG